MLKKITLFGFILGLFSFTACQDDEDFTPEKEQTENKQQGIVTEENDSISASIQVNEEMDENEAVDTGDDRAQLPIKK